MQPVDYLRLLEPDYVASALGSESTSMRDVYGHDSGMSYRLAAGRAHVAQEVVWVEDSFLLLFGTSFHSPIAAQSQVVSDGDWIHVKFQVRGSSEEVLDGGPLVHSASGSCVVARYPAGAVVERTTRADPDWRAACLYFRPEFVRRRLDLPGTVPSELDWLAADGDRAGSSMGFAIDTRASLAVNDLFTCPFLGPIRTNYMHAKAMELFTLSLHQILEAEESRSSVSLSDDDWERIGRVRQILEDEIDSQLTLEQLARRININRSKLAVGFKLMFGDTVQAYWREMRLSRARELLSVHQWSVTDVAVAVGYSDISSLTRAFERRYGVLPKDCRARRSDLGLGEAISRSA